MKLRILSLVTPVLVAVALTTAGCGQRQQSRDPTTPAPAAPAAEAVPPDSIDEAEVAEVEALLAETDTLLASIEAELSQDATGP